MKKKFITGITSVMLTFVFAFAACQTDDPEGGNGGGGGDATTYTVTYDAGSGTATPATAQAEAGSKITEPTATLTGYSVEGWYKESAYTNKWDFSTDTVQSNTTLYAKWTANEYTVTFDVAEGNEMQNSTQTVTYGQPFNLGVTTRSNFYFDGWLYGGKLITDANGAGNGVWTITDNVTVRAKWSAGASIGDDDVTGLIAAISNMGHNYTSSVFYHSGLEWAYDHYCTDDGIYMKYPSEYGSSGFIFKETDGEYLAYMFALTDGIASIDEEPYTWMDGDPYTREYIYGRDYHAGVINPDYYVNQGDGFYSCTEEYLYQQGRALIMENDPSEILIKVADGYIDYISINNFTDRDYGGTDSVWLNFEDIGSTSIDKFLITEKPPFVSQLPSGTDPSKPQAPTTYESAEIKPIDAFDTSVFVNGANDNALPALKAAIDDARDGIRFTREDYYDDTYNKLHSPNYADPNSQYYTSAYDGFKAYLYIRDRYGNFGQTYVLRSGNTVYAVSEENGIVKYTAFEGDAFEDRTWGGNVFNKINASMFEQSSTDANVYTVKSSYLSAVGGILFTTACRKQKDFYTGNPSIVYNSVTLTLDGNKFASIVVERKFTFNDGSTDDIQRMTYSFDYDTPLTMPYETEYTADELVLKNAIAAVGNNYTLDYIYHEGTHITEYYADEGIWKWYRTNEWGSSGFVYINDFAYFIDYNQDGVLEVSDNIWWDGSGPADTNKQCYRAWMNIFYLPLAQIDVKDFTKISDTAYQLKTSAFDKYEGMFFDFEDEGGMLSLTIILDEQGKVSRIESTCPSYLGSGSDVATSTVYVGNVGTTTITNIV